MKTNIITAKTIFYFGILPMIGGLFLFFKSHKLLGILIWILGLCVHMVASKYYKNGPAVDIIIAVICAVFGVFGLLHGGSFWQGTLWLLTTIMLVVAVTT